MLTIAIPTYNRHKELLHTLNLILTYRKDFSFDIIIIDNCSEPPVKEYLENNGYNGFSYTKIIRNGGNIGLSANINMTFLKTEKEWMWLLGDDDPPLENCFTNIFEAIKRVDDSTFLLKFNSNAGQFPKEEYYEIRNEDEFIEFCKNFSFYSNILFISNSIFRTKHMQEHLHYMSNYSSTMASHIIGMIKNLTNNLKIVILNEYITEHGKARLDKAWDKHLLVASVLNFADIQNHEDFKMKMVSNLLVNYIAKNKFYRPFFIYPFRNTSYSADYWRWFYRKSSILFYGFKSYYLVSLSNLVRFYYDNKLLRSMILKRINQNYVQPNLWRS